MPVEKNKEYIVEIIDNGFEVWQGSYDGTIAGFGTVILRKQKQ